MTKFIKYGASFFAVLIFFGCQKAEETKSSNEQNLKPEPSKSATLKPESTDKIDVPKLANKTVEELDKIFGKPEETKKIDNGGEYRLYKIANQPKGLAIRFYGGKAKSFNLILDKPLLTSKEALKQIFGIDVGNISAIKDPKETLSEKYQGTFGGVKFTKVSAKKQDTGKGFIFVLAEVAE